MNNPGLASLRELRDVQLVWNTVGPPSVSAPS
jgi:hypothetical protein